MDIQDRKSRATTRQAELEFLTAGIPEDLSVEEFASMLEDQVEEWNRVLLEQGEQKGEARLLLRQLEEKFGAVDTDSQERVRKADAERLLDWGARLIRARQLHDVFGD